MKRLSLLILTALLFTACAVTKQNHLTIGTFKGQTPQMGSFIPCGEMALLLKPDGVFALNWLHVDYTGAWKVLDGKCLLLEFDKITDLSILLRSGTISDKEQKVKFINKNKIKAGRYVLKREK